MKRSISRVAMPAIAGVFAVGFWSCASAADSRDAIDNSQSVSNTSAPSARELLSLRSPLSGGVIFSPTLSPPTWSPDGSQITFLGSVSVGSLGLWSLNPAGGSPQLLINDVAVNGQPKWSPHGEYLAYISAKGGDSPEIWLW